MCNDACDRVAAGEAPLPAAQARALARPALSVWGSTMIFLLFLIPVAGWLVGGFWALGGTRNRTLRNLARGYLTALLALLIFFLSAALGAKLMLLQF
ncbi:MAG: hypothetical protein PHS97_00830 [Oscillospiraceae bacterium]|nr:hypothetical protein [Oscillospiraceae bacterium]